MKPPKEKMAKVEAVTGIVPVEKPATKSPADVQKNRAMQVASVLSSWSFRRDEFSVTQLFAKGKFKVEMRGAGYRDFVEAVDREDWLAAFNKLTGAERVELPPNREIDEVLTNFRISKSPFLIFVDKRGADLKAIKAREDWRQQMGTGPFGHPQRRCHCRQHASRIQQTRGE